MNRRSFLAALAVPFIAKAVPCPRPASWKLPHKNGKTRMATEYLESRTFSVEEIARIFDVPPHMVVMRPRTAVDAEKFRADWEKIYSGFRPCILESSYEPPRSL